MAQEATVPGVEDERIARSIAAYGKNAREFQEHLRHRRPLQDVRRFAQLADRGALVLDVGCGPASDLRSLRDRGLRPVGVDLAFGALEEARMLLPRDPLVQAPYDRLPFRRRVFAGLWMNGAFAHLPRAAWRDTFALLLSHLDKGPVYFACIRGSGDLQRVDDPILGEIYRSDATEEEVAAMLASHGIQDLRVEIHPDPLLDRERPWVIALGRVL
ncbi:MAG: class I SAM-dependent methyltransferase [Nitriliruptorales bacterium]